MLYRRKPIPALLKRKQTFVHALNLERQISSTQIIQQLRQQRRRQHLKISIKIAENKLKQHYRKCYELNVEWINIKVPIRKDGKPMMKVIHVRIV